MNRALIVTSALACAANANAAFIGAAVVEGDSAGASAVLGQAATVLNVYATFDGIGDGSVNTVVSTSFVNINAVSGTFYQDAFGGLTPPNAAFFPLAPTLQYDSFGTIGAPTNAGPGAAISTEPGTAASDTNFSGGWFNSNPPNAVGGASVDLGNGTFGTLLFQFTLLGLGETGANAVSELLSGSFSVYTQAPGEAIENPVKLIVPTPGAMALFGVAGLATLRRRR